MPSQIGPAEPDYDVEKRSSRLCRDLVNQDRDRVDVLRPHHERAGVHLAARR
jgi:hypothetical protein